MIARTMPPKKPVSKAPRETAASPAAKKPARQKSAPKQPRVAAAKVAPEEREAPSEPVGRYWQAVGRRKTATARVRLFTKGEKGMWVNGKPASEYFGHARLGKLADEALGAMNTGDRFRTTVKVSGGGLHAQAEAVRHGTARALVLFNQDFRKRLKRAGFLTRDPRMKERKKFGLKGARRAPQWSKR